jgi:hypothetical protein
MKVSVRRQISVVLENQPGALGRICRLIGQAGINIQAISIIDNVEQGMIRLIVDQPDACRELLRKDGFYLIEADLLQIEMPNRAGTLGEVGYIFAENQINIDYAYGTENQEHQSMCVLLKVPKTNEAIEILKNL